MWKALSFAPSSSLISFLCIRSRGNRILNLVRCPLTKSLCLPQQDRSMTHRNDWLRLPCRGVYPSPKVTVATYPFLPSSLPFLSSPLVMHTYWQTSPYFLDVASAPRFPRCRSLCFHANCYITFLLGLISQPTENHYLRSFAIIVR